MQQIRLLGKVLVETDGHSSRLVNSARGVALLAYLVYTNDIQNREHVADLLWEATSTRQSLTRLRELLGRVRKWLPQVKTTRQTVTFQPDDSALVDLWALRQGLQATDNLALDEALQLYKGDFLANFHLDDAAYFNEWLLLARERLRLEVLAAHGRLCQLYAESEMWDKGVAVARRWVALAPFHEEAHRWLMVLLTGNGQGTAALHAYKICRQILQKELGVEPGVETVALAQQLTEWRGSIASLAFEDVSLVDVLMCDDLPEPGLLPSNAMLPYQRNQDFVGRAGDLLQMARLLSVGTVDGRSSVVALTGMGGLGKTQMAVEFCYRYGRYFDGGVFWLSFAKAENVIEEVAAVGSERGLGLYQEAEQLTLLERAGRVQRAWQESLPRLLVFDNCEEEELLKQWLPTTGSCYVLLTSRRAHWSREINVSVLPLRVLQRSESIKLLQQLAPHLSQNEVDEIAAEVGDLPLAIHLAGVFLHRYQRIAAAAYLAQLRDEGLLAHPSLQGRGASHSPTGHELHVARTFALNLNQLEPHNEVDKMSRRLLTHIACFAPGEPLVEDLLRATVSESDDLMVTMLVEDGLNRLVALGFLEREEQENVWLHRLLAAFVVAELVTDEARTAVENSLCRQLATYVEQVYQADLPPVPITHLRYVTDMALTRSAAAASVLTLALGKYLRSVGEYVSAQSYLEKGLSIAKEVYVQGRILSILARAYYSQGFHREAHQNSVEAERLLRLADAPNRAWLIGVLLRRGWAELRLGQAKPALAAAKEAWQLSVVAEDLHNIADCLNLMGSIQFFLLSDYEAAERHFEQAKAAYQQLGDSFGEATTLLNLGESANAQGDYPRAKANMQAALVIIRRIDNRMRELSALISLGEVLVRLGEYETAVSHLNHVIAQAPSNWTYAPIAYHALAEAYLGQGKVVEALQTMQTADTLHSADDPFVSGIGWRIVGQIVAQRGEAVAAWTGEGVYTVSGCFACSLQLFTDIDNRREQAMVLWQWASYELAHGDKRRGEKMWQEAREILAQLNLPLLLNQMDSEWVGNLTGL